MNIPADPNYQQFVLSRFKRGELLPSDPLSLMLNHAILAIPAELGELVETDADFLEEGGDVLFYLQAIINCVTDQQKYWSNSLCLGVGVKFRPNGFTNFPNLVIAASKLTDEIKQVTVYGKLPPLGWDRLVANRCIIVAELLLTYIRQCDPKGYIDGKYDTFDQLMKANQAKLTKRHPVTYTDDQALNKADHSEEGKVDWDSLDTKPLAESPVKSAYVECNYCHDLYSSAHFSSCPTCNGLIISLVK